MDGFHCPFCSSNMAVSADTHRTQYPSFDSSNGKSYTTAGYYIDESCIQLDFYKCPRCNKYSIIASECGSYSKGLYANLIPNSQAKCFPEYIPYFMTLSIILQLSAYLSRF